MVNFLYHVLSSKGGLMKKQLVLFSFLFSSLWSFECSSPTTIYKAPEGGSLDSIEMAVNDSGAVAVAWVENYDLKFAFKENEGTSFSIEEVFPDFGLDNDLFQCTLDSFGNVHILWDDDVDDELFALEKPVGGPFGDPVWLGEYTETFLNPNGDIEVFHETWDEEGKSRRVGLIRKPLGNSHYETPIPEEEIPSDIAPMFTKNKKETEFFCGAIELADGLNFYFTRREKGGEWPEEVEEIFVPSWTRYVGLDKFFVDAEENIHLLGMDYDGFLFISRADGKWIEPEFVETNIDGHGYREGFNCVMDGDGNLMAVWTLEMDYNSTLYAAYKPKGKPWLSPIALSSPAEKALSPLLRVDEQGHFVIVWSRSVRWCFVDVQAMVFSAQTEQWSDPILISGEDRKCMSASFELSSNGKGVIALLSFDDPFDKSLKLVTFSLD